MKNEMEHGLVEPFDIDDGSIAGVTPEYAFALGVEWQLFRQRLETGKPFKMFCLPQNARRLISMAERHRQFCEDRQTAGIDWTQIWVGDSIGCEPLESEPR